VGLCLSKSYMFIKKTGFQNVRFHGIFQLKFSTAFLFTHNMRYTFSHFQFHLLTHSKWIGEQPLGNQILSSFFSSLSTDEGVSKSFRTGRLERELQMVQLSATRCSCIAILWVIIVRFAAITLCVPSQRVFIILLLLFISLSIQSGNFLIHPRILNIIISACSCLRIRGHVSHACKC
jgi:hypothetical protein